MMLEMMRIWMKKKRMTKKFNKNEIFFYKRMTALTGGHFLFANKRVLTEEMHPQKRDINSVFSRDYNSLLSYLD